MWRGKGVFERQNYTLGGGDGKKWLYLPRQLRTWIPAFAGMTIRGDGVQSLRINTNHSLFKHVIKTPNHFHHAVSIVIPAFAGIRRALVQDAGSLFTRIEIFFAKATVHQGVNYFRFFLKEAVFCIGFLAAPVFRRACFVFFTAPVFRGGCWAFFTGAGFREACCVRLATPGFRGVCGVLFAGPGFREACSVLLAGPGFRGVRGVLFAGPGFREACSVLLAGPGFRGACRVLLAGSGLPVVCFVLASTGLRGLRGVFLARVVLGGGSCFLLAAPGLEGGSCLLPPDFDVS